MKKYFVIFVALLIIPVLSGMAIAGDAGASFSLGPNMNTARMGHYSITLNDGRVVLFGGHGTNFVSLNTAEVWSSPVNSFTTLQMNYTHDGSAFAKLADGRYLIAGGAADLGVAPGFSTAEIYNPSDNLFTPTTTMTYPRMNTAAATLTSGKVLVAGGWYDSNSSTYGELYDPATGKFTATRALNTPRAIPVVLPTNDDKAVVFGGIGVYGDPASIEQVELYDPGLNSFSILQNTLFTGENGWTIYGSSNIPRSIETQKLSDGRYLLLAWKSAGSITEYTLFTFDPATKKFAKLNTTPALPDSSTVGLWAPIVNQAKGKAYLFSYVLPYTSPISVRLYTVDPAANTLTTPAGSYTLPDSYYLNGIGSTLLADGRVFLTGGNSQTGYNTNFSPVKNTFFAVPDGTLPPPALPGPQNLRFTLTGNMLTINWDAAAGAAGYKAGLSAQTGNYPQIFDLGNILQLGPMDIMGVPSGTYYISVKAYNGLVESAYSNEIAITLNASALPAPQNLRYTLSGNMLTISWDAAAGATGYKVGLGTGSGIYSSLFDVSNVTQVGPLDMSAASGTYYLAVKAYNSKQESGYSNETVIKLGSQVTEHVDLTTLTDGIFSVLGQTNPAISPTIWGIIRTTFQAGGPEALANLAVVTYPNFITKIPNGILLDYKGGYTLSTGTSMKGSIAITHSGIVTVGQRTTGNIAVVANNVYRNGKYLGDGSGSGKVDITIGANNNAVGDVSFNGNINSVEGTGTISGNAHIDGNVCPNYPVSGSLSLLSGGQTKTINFNNKCDGTFDDGPAVSGEYEIELYILDCHGNFRNEYFPKMTSANGVLTAGAADNSGFTISGTITQSKVTFNFEKKPLNTNDFSISGTYSGLSTNGGNNYVGYSHYTFVGSTGCQASYDDYEVMSKK